MLEAVTQTNIVLTVTSILLLILLIASYIIIKRLEKELLRQHKRTETNNAYYKL
jgi:hypothetical protein